MAIRIGAIALWGFVGLYGWQFVAGLPGFQLLGIAGLAAATAAVFIAIVDPRQFFSTKRPVRRVLNPSELDTSPSGIPAVNPQP